MLGMHDARHPRPPKAPKGQGLTADMAMAYLRANPTLCYRGQVLIQLVRLTKGTANQVIEAWYRVPADPQHDVRYYRFLLQVDSDDVSSEELRWAVQWGMVATQYPTLPVQ